MYSKVQEKFQEFLTDNKIKEEESTGTKFVILPTASFRSTGTYVRCKIFEIMSRLI